MVGKKVNLFCVSKGTGLMFEHQEMSSKNRGVSSSVSG